VNPVRVRMAFARRFMVGVGSLFFAAVATASTCTINPAVPVAGQTVTVSYDPAGGPLAGAGTIQIYRSFNGWMQIAGPDQTMTRDLATGRYTFGYIVPEAAYELNMVFHDTSTPVTWDNNGTADWNFPVTPAPPPNPLPAPPALPANASRAGVMMQGFYWDCPPGWYNTMAAQAAALRNMRDGQGIDRIWFPPPAKAQSGAGSMGYDPYDYYDLGAYNQKGTVATHFGTQAELKAAIAAFRAQGIVCLADIVLNHRSGGASELNPNLNNTSTWTDFSGVASGWCAWHYNQFHPSTHEGSDEGNFGDMPDVCLARATPDSAGWPRYDLIQWGNWLMDSANAGFDGGWRFDYVKGYRPSLVADFRAGTGNAFGVIECWDGDVNNVEAYVTYTAGTSAFDFPGYYTMADVFNHAGSVLVAHLVDPTRVYAAKNPAHTVTFVANHDTDMIGNDKMLAYAFILTHQGYPCLFWADYFNRGLATLGGQAGNGLNALVWVRGALGGGAPVIENLLTSDSDLLVYGTAGGSASAPGYLVAINVNSASARSATVTTSDPALRGATLICHAWYSYVSGGNVQPASVTCGADGAVTVSAPPSGYAVYSVSLAPPSAAPVGLTATAGNAQVSLRWSAVSDATSYNVKRATTRGGPYTTIANPAFTSYTDTAVSNGTTYHYVVSAVNSSGESADSAAVSATPAAPAPPPPVSSGGSGGAPSWWFAIALAVSGWLRSRWRGPIVRSGGHPRES
jgi:alpha-amylase